MKRTFFLCLVLSLNSTLFISAQDIELPRLSPKASVSYTIGLTNIDIHYGSPAVKERAIWGNLVPYDKVWRAGANEATTVEFSTDVNMEGQTLKAGKYALFIIPGQTEWTVIFNKKFDQWGAYSYEESEDALRISVTPKLNEGMQERLVYSIHDMKMDMGYIKLSWEKMRLYMRFKTNMMEEAMANIADALEASPEEKKWIVYAQGAQFLMDADGNLDQALEWVKKSTDRFSTSWNWYIRAQVEAKKGDMMAAVASGTKCAEIGLANEEDHYYEDNKEEINSAIQGWAAKMN
ncbi:MAG TPA: DUF2911 domain-containing protein [Saprospiraceae bacterium]|nr:DUF2911 domain-containing protein [Saprospiraceae bacterium]